MWWIKTILGTSVWQSQLQMQFLYGPGDIRTKPETGPLPPAHALQQFLLLPTSPALTSMAQALVLNTGVSIPTGSCEWSAIPHQNCQHEIRLSSEYLCFSSAIKGIKWHSLKLQCYCIAFQPHPYGRLVAISRTIELPATHLHLSAKLQNSQGLFFFPAQNYQKWLFINQDQRRWN